MFAITSRWDIFFRALLSGIVLFNALVPSSVLASSPSTDNTQSISHANTIQENEDDQNNTYTSPKYTHPSPRIAERPEQDKNSLVQTSSVVLQCTNYYGDSYCEDPNPGTTLVETIDTTTDMRYIRFNVLCDGVGCRRDVYYHAILSVEWGNGWPGFNETASVGAEAYFGAGTGNISQPCGSGSSGSCQLETYGVIKGIYMNAGAPYQFDIYNTGGTSATGEWHHRVLTLTVSLSPLGIPDESVNCKSCSPYNSTQSFAADPVNTHTGTMSYPVKDMEFVTSAGTLSFSHTYISSEIARFTSPLGFGWTHNQDIRLIFPSENEPPYVLFKDHSGNLYRFQDMGDGTYTPYSGITSSLVKNPGSPITYTLQDQSQNIYEFDAEGKLTSSSDPNGHAFTYTYGANGQVSRISADNGTRYLDFSYNLQNLLETVTNHAGQSVGFQYDVNGDMTSYTDVSGNTWTYIYDSEHHLTQVNDPDGNMTLQSVYDTNGRVTHQSNGNGETIASLQYNANNTTVVTDAMGNDQTQTYNTAGALITDIDPAGGETSKTYDTNFRPATVTDSNGTTTFTWSADGANLTHVQDAGGNQTDITYNSFNKPISVIDPLSHLTTFNYDGSRLVSVTNALNQTTSYTYTPEDYLASITAVRV